MKTQITIIILLVLISINCKRLTSLTSQAQSFNCPKDNIKLSERQGQCSCPDGQKCVFDQERPLMGCPCKGKSVHQNTCLQMAKQHGCENKNIDCTGDMGSCTCKGGGKCIWQDGKPLVGCPCGSQESMRVKSPGMRARDDL